MSHSRTKSLLRRLPHSPNKIVWPKRWIRLLGTKPDRRVARQLGIHEGTVREERTRRGIAPFRARSPDVRWSNDWIAVLGEATDKEVAAELGLPVGSVSRKRRILGIAPFAPSTRARFERRSFWTKRRLALLGTASDCELARRWNVRSTAVAYRRQVEGIAPFRPRPRRRAWSRVELRSLGTEPDGVLALRLGRSAADVRTERHRRKIPPWRAPPRKVLPTPAVKRLLSLSTREAVARTGLSAASPIACSPSGSGSRSPPSSGSGNSSGD